MKRLRYFRAVVEAGSLTAAASVVHLTPGALSKAMARLEDEVGRALFVRVGRGLVLTSSGRRLYAQSGSLVEEYARVLHAMNASERAPAMLLRLASFEVFTTYALPYILAALPDHRVDVFDLAVGAIEGAVLGGEADLGVTYVPKPDGALEHMDVGSVTFGTFGPQALASLPPHEVPFAIPVSTLRGDLTDLMAIDGWPSLRFSRRVAYRLTMLESALALARQGRCAVFAPSFLVDLHNRETVPASRLVQLALPEGMEPVVRRVHAVARRERSGDPAIRAACGAIRGVLSADVAP